MTTSSLIPPTSHFHTTRNGTRTHYTRHGASTPRLLILLHGIGGSTENFETLLPYLPLQDYNIISIDLEGCGKTALTGDAELSVQRYVDDFADLIEFLQKQYASEPKTSSTSDQGDENGVVILGSSLGSIIALQYTALYPTNVRGLGLMPVGRSASHIPSARERMLSTATAVRAGGMKAVASSNAMKNFPSERHHHHRNTVEKMLLDCNPEAFARTWEAMARPDHRDPEYGRVKCPTVFVMGDKDVISPPSRAYDIAAVLGGESRVYLVDGGHQLLLSDLEGVVGALGWLWERVDGREEARGGSRSVAIVG